MDRLSYVGQRLLQMIPTAIGTTIIVFFLVHLIPGDPARTMLGVHATDRAVAQLHEQWGLDKPLPEQYVDFMGRLVHGDLGQSLYFQVPTRQLVGERLPATLWLLGYSVALAIVISVPLAMLAALRKDRPADHAIRAVPLVGLGMPSFWVGIMLILLLAVKLELFPVSGYGHGFADHLWAMFLPSLTIAIALSPILIRSLRASLIGVLESDYVATARSKGLPERRVLVRHALRNAVISTVTVLGINVGYLVGGTVVVEKVFALPGVGALLIDAILQRDFTVVQTVTLFFAVIVVLVFLITDLLYSLLDPRVTFGR